MISRTVATLIASTVILIGLGVGELIYIEQSSDRLMKSIDDLESHVDGRNWKEAKDRLDDLEKLWDHTRSHWSLFLHHSELDEMSMSMARAAGYLKAKSRIDLISEVSTMKALVNHIPEMEKVNMTTIL